MTEVIKADPLQRKRAYIFIIVIALFAVSFQTDYVSSLFSIDTTGMNLHQKLEASKQELIYATMVNAIFILIAGYFSYRLITISKQTFIEKRYPPEGYKAPVDTKVVYGSKAKVQAYLMIIVAIVILISPMIRTSTILYMYNVIDESSTSVIESEVIMNKYYDELIAKEPISVSAIHYYFKRNKPDEAIKLMDNLILEGSDEALFAKTSEALKGENLPQETDSSINTLTLMCNDYVEPCLLLAINYKQEKQYDLSLEYFLKAASKDYTRVYREIRYLYNRSNLNDRDKLNEYTDKMNNSKSSLCDEIYCLTKH